MWRLSCHNLRPNILPGHYPLETIGHAVKPERSTGRLPSPDDRNARAAAAPKAPEDAFETPRP